MSGLPIMSGVGRLTVDPALRFSPSGMAVCEVSLAFNSRKLNRDTNVWEDADVFFVRATAFKQLAENAGECLSKGMEVVVSGRVKTEQWNDKATGEKRSATALLLDSIGPNLAHATAKVTRAQRGSDAPAHGRSGSGGSSSAPSGDPWGSDIPPPDSEMAPF